MKKLTEFQQDAIAELLNIGMGRAAASLSEMVEEPVNLSIPKVEFIPKKDAIEQLHSIIGEKVTAIRESFSGSFWGDALLLFPENRSLELVRALIKDDSLPVEMLSELEQEALTEVGNIILNACLGSLANIFKQTLHFQLPQYTHGSCDQVINETQASNSSAEGVLLLQMNFSLQETDISGYLTLLMDVDSMQALSENLNLYFGLINVEG